MSKKPVAKPVKISHLSITLSDGVKLSATLWLPAASPAPALVEIAALTSAREDSLYNVLAKDGYAVIRLDQRGTGDSQGTFSGGFDRQDETDALQVLNFIAEQKWCDGKIGLFGFANAGTAALQVARRQPVGLGAVIAVAATDDPYVDGGAYQGGVVRGDMLLAAAQQLATSALPPAAKKAWPARLKAQKFIAANWLHHCARDDEWKAQAASEDLGQITAPCLLVSDWAKASPIPRMMLGLRSPCKAVIGPWDSAIDFSVEMLRWFDQHLKGKATGIMQEQAYRYFMRDAGHETGRWLGDMMWGAGAFAEQRLYLTGAGLADTRGENKELTFSSPLTCGFGTASGLADGAARDDSASLTFDSPALAADLDVVGQPSVALDMSTDATVSQVFVRLTSVGPAGENSLLSQQMLNLTQRVSRGSPSALEAGQRYTVNVVLADMALRLPKGHKLRLAISTSCFPLGWPAPSKVALTVHTGNSALALPIRKDRGMESLITFAPLAKPSVAGPTKRAFTLDPVSSEAKLVTDDSTFTVKPDDALSAKQSVEATASQGKIKTVVQAKLSGSAKLWTLSAKLEAFDGKKKVFTKTYDEKIVRKLV